MKSLLIELLEKRKLGQNGGKWKILWMDNIIKFWEKPNGKNNKYIVCNKNILQHNFSFSLKHRRLYNQQ